MNGTPGIWVDLPDGSQRAASPQELAGWIWKNKKTLRQLADYPCDCGGESKAILARLYALPSPDSAPPGTALTFDGERLTSGGRSAPIACVLDLLTEPFVHLARCKACGSAWLFTGNIVDGNAVIEARKRAKYLGRIALQ